MTEKCGIKFSMELLHPRHWGAWFGLAIFALIGQLPTSARHFLGRRVGRNIFNKKNQKRQHVVATNLRIAFPELSNKQNNQKQGRVCSKRTKKEAKASLLINFYCPIYFRRFTPIILRIDFS